MILQKIVNTTIMTPQKLSVRLIRRKKKKYYHCRYCDTENITTPIIMTQKIFPLLLISLKYCGSYYYDSNKMSVFAYLLL